MASYSIGDLARITGVKPTTIRWYEQEGWLQTALRTQGGHRVYSPSHLRRLGFLRHARELGFESEAIRSLLALADRPEDGCDRAHALATEQIRQIDQRMEKLLALRQELERMASSCKGGVVAECRVIESLAEFSHSSGDDLGHARNVGSH
jgi:DNA-binding transcriptional MerR regulator